jgi:NAD(P)-dependent dehydrogenase (short-subunit alcohol dehydrogenase family)
MPRGCATSCASCDATSPRSLGRPPERYARAIAAPPASSEQTDSPAGSGVAVVTGGGSGIGRAAALALADAGFRVAVSGRRPEPLAETARRGAERGGQIAAIPADVCDPASVEALFETTVAAFGRVDVLFNNAGIGQFDAPLVDISLEDWRATIETNVTGMFLCTQCAIRQMLAQAPRGGRIINNGSISAHAPRPRSAPYTASKHAVTGFTKSVALDHRDFDIACGQIDIGNARTELTGDRVDGRGIIQADGQLREEATIDVEHVARAVVYMATLPLEVNVLFMTVMASRMPYVGRG